MAENNMKNEINLSMVISKDFTTKGGTIIPAVRKVSDKMTVLNCYFGNKQNGYGNMTVHVFSSTKTAGDVKFAPGKGITVSGWLGVDSYTDKNGNKRTNIVLNAREITALPPYDGNNAGSSASATPAASNTSAANDDNPWAAGGDDSSMWQ